MGSKRQREKSWNQKKKTEFPTKELHLDQQQMFQWWTRRHDIFIWLLHYWEHKLDKHFGKQLSIILWSFTLTYLMTSNHSKEILAHKQQKTRMFITVLLLTAKIWNNSKAYERRMEEVICGTGTQRNSTQLWKRMHYNQMQQSS